MPKTMLFRKASAIITALTMVLTSTLPAFAAQQDLWDNVTGSVSPTTLSPIDSDNGKSVKTTNIRDVMKSYRIDTGADTATLWKTSNSATDINGWAHIGSVSSGLPGGVSSNCGINGYAFPSMKGNVKFSLFFSDYGAFGNLNEVQLKEGPVASPITIDVFKKLAVGGNNTAMVGKYGNVFTAGAGSVGALGNGTTTGSLFAKKTPITDVKMISAGANHMLAIKNDGSLIAWGYNNAGQLGDGTTTNKLSATTISIPGSVVDIAAGINGSLAVNDLGDVYAFGANPSNFYGFVGASTVPKKIPSLSGINNVAIASSVQAFFFKKQDGGEVYSIGSNGYGQLGDGTTVDKTSPVLVSGSSNATIITAGGYHAGYVTDDGKLYTWGYNNNGQIGNGGTTNQTTPTNVVLPAKVKQLAMGTYHTVVLLDNGAVYAWGSNSNGQLGDGTTTGRSVPAVISGIPSNVVSIAAGGMSTEILFADGSIVAFGANSNGKLGVGDNVDAPSGKYVVSPVDVNIVAASKYASFFIAKNGTVKSVGDFTNGVLGTNASADATSFKTIPGLTNVLSISASSSEYNVLALKSDGTVVEWGKKLSDGSSKPTPTAVAGLTGVAQISAGTDHSVALLQDGRVMAWGYNANGQLGQGDTTTRLTPTVVPGLSNIVRVSTEGDTTLALSGNGTVWAFGGNANGQIGNGTTVDALSPVQISGLTGIANITAGKTNSYAITEAGAVYAWGSNSDGQLGDNGVATSNRLTPAVVSGLTGISKMGAGSADAFSISTAGAVKGWGYNDLGSVGVGNNTLVSVPATVSISSNPIVDISGGDYSSIAIDSAGQVFTWGSNNNGQVSVGIQGNGTTAVGPGDRNAPGAAYVPVPTSPLVFGYDHALALSSDGTTLMAWGAGSPALGSSTAGSFNAKKVSVSITNVAAIYAGNQTSYAILTNGTVKDWGVNGNGQLGDGTNIQKTSPSTVASMTNIVSIAPGNSHTLFLASDGTIKGAGNGANGALAQGADLTSKSTPVSIADISTAIGIAAGNNSSYALLNDGTVMAWGANTNGQLGLGDNVDKTAPTAISGLSDVAAVYAGAKSAFFLKNDGTVWATGLNTYGVLGLGNTTDVNVPTLISTLPASVIAVSVKTDTALALLSNGTVYSWGANANGQLGNGTLTQSNTPAQIAGITNAVAIATMPTFSGVMLADGTILGFGSNVNGEVGTEAVAANTNSLSAATSSQTFTNRKNFAGYGSAYSISADGKVYTWGVNNYGQLGIGSTTNQLNAMNTVSGITNAVSGSAGAYHAGVVLADGTLKTWGRNAQGQLGIGSTTDSNVPVTVSSLSNVKKFVAGGAYNSAALLADGTLWTWGSSGSGQLGNGTITGSSTPVQVCSVGNAFTDGTCGGKFLTNVVDVAMTKNGATLALLGSGRMVSFGSGSYGMLGNNGTTSSAVPVFVSGTFTGPTQIVKIAGGDANFFAISASGNVYAWGYNATNCIGTGTAGNVLAPTQLPGIGNATDLFMTSLSDVYFAKTTTGYYSWGNGSTQPGTLGNGLSGIVSTPTAITATNVIDIFTAAYTTYFVLSDGTIQAVGANSSSAEGALGNGTTIDSPAPYNRTFVLGKGGDVSRITAGWQNGFFIMPNNTVYSFGYQNNDGVFGTSGQKKKNFASVVRGLKNVIQIVANKPANFADTGSSSLIVLNADKTVSTLGAFSTGATSYLPVTNIGSIVDAKAVAIGYNTNYILRDDGTVSVFGTNDFGQFGNGTTTANNTPTTIPGLTGVRNISGGYKSAYVALVDGTMKAFGWNVSGQLGNGNTTNQSSPVVVPGVTGVVKSDAGYNHVLALKTDGTVYSWGDNTGGKLCRTTNATTPTTISGLANVQEISAGADHSLFQKSDGTVWGCGKNDYGQLGNGSTTDSSTPVQVTGITNAVGIAAGRSSSIVLLSDGTIKTFGNNAYGALGNGTFTSSSLPTTVVGGREFSRVATSGSTGYVIQPEGVYSFGMANGGINSLGYDTSTDQTAAKLIPGTSGVASVATSKNGGVLALKNDGTVLAFGKAVPMTSSDFTLSNNGSSTFSWTGTKFTASRPSTNLVSSMRSNTSKNSGVIVAQANINWDTASTGTEDLAFLQLANSTSVVHGYSGASSYGASISSRTNVSGGGKFRMRAGNTTSILYDADSTVNKGSDVKVVYDTSNNQIKYYYWSGSSWTQIGTTQTYDIKNGGSIYALLGYDWINTSLGNVYFDNIFFDSYASDYSTRFPQSASSAGIASVPTAVAGITNATDVAVGDAAYYVLTGGNVKSWGYNGSGQLGNGTTSASVTSTLNTVCETGTGGSCVPLANVVKIIASGNSAMALKADGSVWTWGDNTYYQLGNGNTTASSNPIKIIAADAIDIFGGNSSMSAVMYDGSVKAWGLNSNAQLGASGTMNTPTVVAGLQGAVAISYGTDHSVVLFGSGNTRTIGNNTSGQLGNGTTTASTTLVDPSVSSASVAAGDKTTLMVGTGGSVYSTGNNTNGQGGIGITTPVSLTSPNAVKMNKSYPKVFSGSSSNDTFLIAGAVGGVLGAGVSDRGQNGSGVSLATSVSSTWTPSRWNNAATSINIVQGAGGADFGVAVDNNGAVYGWGDNNVAQMGNGTGTTIVSPAAIASLANNVSKVGASGRQAFAIRNNVVYAWGYGAYPTGSAVMTTNTTPTVLGAGKDAAIGGDGSFVAILANDGRVSVGGNAAFAGLGNLPNQTYITGLSNISTISAGYDFLLALDANGDIYALGKNTNGQLGLGDTVDRTAPTKISAFTGKKMVSISAGKYFATALDSTGVAYVWGMGSDGQIANGATSNALTPIAIPGLPSILDIASGSAHWVARGTDGSIWTGGRAVEGQRANGSVTANANPTKLAVRISDNFTMANNVTGYVDSTGKVYMAGYNAYGQVGDNTTTTRQLPVVAIASGAVSVTANNNSVYSIQSDGTVKAYGRNDYGQLGDGTTTDRAVPTIMKGPNGSGNMTGVAQIRPGFWHSEILKTDGTVWGVGYNLQGQIGMTSMTNQSYPVQAVGLSNIKAIASGPRFSMALGFDGNVWTWGGNAAGQLGNGTTTDNGTPAKVSNLSEVTAIAAGGDTAGSYGYSLALMSDGTVSSWGYNGNGMLGDGTTTNRLTPVKVCATGSWTGSACSGTQLSNIVSIEARGPAAYAVASDGTVWSWGNNTNGVVGNGSVTAANVVNPSKVCLSGTWDSATSKCTVPLKILSFPSGAYQIEYFNDGVSNITNNYASGSGNFAVESVIMDLGASYNISKLYVWHYYGDSRTYKSLVYQVSNDPTFQTGVTTVFNNDTTNKAGQGVGTDATYAESSAGKTVSFTAVSARYIRFFSAGSTVNGGNHYIEVKTDARQDPLTGVSKVVAGLNDVAFLMNDGSVRTLGYNNYGGDLTGNTTLVFNTVKAAASAFVSGSVATTTVNVCPTGFLNGSTCTILPKLVSASTWPVTGDKYISDGNYIPTDQGTEVQYATLNTGAAYMKFDLGAAVTVTKIKVWNYYGDGRQFKNLVYQLSNDPNFVSGVTTVYNGDTTNMFGQGAGTATQYAETIAGKTITVSSVNARYMRVMMNGNTVNTGNYVTEIQVEASVAPVSTAASGVQTLSTAVQDMPISYGSLSSGFIASDGWILTAGQNSYGQAGTGNTNAITQFTPVTGLPGGITPKYLSLGGRNGDTGHSVAVMSDGSVYSWGANFWGQLGDNTQTNRSAPVKMLGVGGTGYMSGIIQADAGMFNTMLLKSDGTVYGVGHNGQGMLANCSNGGNQLVPCQITGIYDAVQVSNGARHALVLASDGRVYAFGRNDGGFLGTGNTTAYASPVPVCKSGAYNGSACPEPLRGVSQVVAAGYDSVSSAGAETSMVLMDDGTVMTFGSNSYGNLGDGTTTTRSNPVYVKKNANEMLTGIVQVAMNENWGSYALASDGTVWAWGYNGDAELGTGNTTNYSYAAQVCATGTWDGSTCSGGAPLSNVKAISASGLGAMALMNDGTIRVWGYNNVMQVGNLTTTNATRPAMPFGFGNTATADPLMLAMGSNGVLALKNQIFVWGSANSAFTAGSTSYYPSNLKSWNASYNGTMKGIAASYGAGADFFIVMNDGTVRGYGQNSGGIQGNGGTTQVNSPTAISGLTNVDSLSAGNVFALALLTDGSVKSWGTNSFYQLGNGTSTTSYSPMATTITSGAKQVAAGNYYGLVLMTDGTVKGFGNNASYQLGNGTNTTVTTPTTISGLTGVSSIAAGGSTAYYLMNDGTVKVSGYNAAGQACSAGGANVTVPTTIAGLTGVSKVFAGPTDVGFIMNDGTVKLCGQTYGTTPTAVSWATGGNVVTMSIASGAIAFGMSNGDILVAGSGNSAYRMGDGALNSSYTLASPYKPMSFSVLSASTAVTTAPRAKFNNVSGSVSYGAGEGLSAGGNAYFINTASGLKSFGSGNAAGQLGVGNPFPGIGYSSPIFTTYYGAKKVAQLPNTVVQVSNGGGSHAMALSSDGTVYTWGGGSYGQLGAVNMANDSLPSQVPGLTSVIQIASNANSSLALKSDGTIWAWGNNSVGQLGDGTTTNRNVPVKVMGINNAIRIAAGDDHAAALLSDGTVATWGNNAYGQLSIGNTSNMTVPAKACAVGSWNGVNCTTMLTGVKDVKAIGVATFFLMNDNTVLSVGYAAAGQLGNGLTTNYSNPVRVCIAGTSTAYNSGCTTQLTNVAKLFTASNSSAVAALMSDGTAYAWGANGNKQIVTGNSTNYSNATLMCEIGVTAGTSCTGTGALPLQNVAGISISDPGTLVMKTDGTVLTTLAAYSDSTSTDNVRKVIDAETPLSLPSNTAPTTSVAFSIPPANDATILTSFIANVDLPIGFSTVSTSGTPTSVITYLSSAIANTIGFIADRFTTALSSMNALVYGTSTPAQTQLMAYGDVTKSGTSTTNLMVGSKYLSVVNPCQFAISPSGTGVCSTGLNIFTVPVFNQSEANKYSLEGAANNISGLCVNDVALQSATGSGVSLSGKTVAFGLVSYAPQATPNTFSKVVNANGNNPAGVAAITEAQKMSEPASDDILISTNTPYYFNLAQFKRPDGTIAGHLLLDVYLSQKPTFSSTKKMRFGVTDQSGIRRFTWAVDNNSSVSGTPDVGWNTFAFPFAAANFSSTDGSTMYDFDYAHVRFERFGYDPTSTTIFTDAGGNPVPAVIALDNIRYSDTVLNSFDYTKAFNDNQVAALGGVNLYVTDDNTSWGKTGEISASGFSPINVKKLRGSEIYALGNTPSGWASYYSLDKTKNGTVYQSNSGVTLKDFDLYDYNYGFSISNVGDLYRVVLQPN